MTRWIAIIVVLVLAAVVAQQRGLGSAEVLARLVSAITPAPAQGKVTETLRPDLSGGDPDPKPVFAPQGNFVRHDLTFKGQVRHWWSLGGANVQGSALQPAVVLLHGSGRDGAAMLALWQAIGTESAVLIAPDANDPNTWQVAQDGPEFLDAVLDAAATVTPFDRREVFLYGHSGGARFALYLAACAPRPWRAAAVHAGSWPACTALAQNAGIPLLIQIGDQDPLFDLATVRQSATGLGQAGHAVSLEVIPQHGHWLYDIGPRLAADAWAFFASLP